MARSPHIATAVEKALRELLATSFEPGAQLPAERELADMIGASRPTLREVVSSLCRAGVLERRWGVGTFVAEQVRPFTMSLGAAFPLRTAAIEQGFDAVFGPFRVELVPCPPDVAARLDVEPGEEVWEVDRVLHLDGRPAITLVDTVPQILGGVRLDMSGFGTDGTVDFIPFVFEQTGLLMTTMDATIRPTTATPESARLLQVDVGTPLIQNIQIARSDDGTLVTHTEALYVHGRVELHVIGAGRGLATSHAPPEKGTIP